MNHLNFRLQVLLLWTSMLSAHGQRDEYFVLEPPQFNGNKVHFKILGEADAVYVIESSKDGIFWAPRVTNYDRTITRFISLDRSPNADFYRGWRRRLPVFSAALAARTTIDLLGHGLSVDSYDSSSPAYSSNGVYDPAKRKAGGDVATVDGAVNVGNARIHGQIRTGVKGAFSFGPLGFAGPLGWEGPGLFSEDYYRRDFRFVIPDVPVPFPTGLFPGSQGTNSWVLATGDYCIPGNLNMNDQTMLVLGSARLLVKGDLNMTSTAQIRIASGASLQLYVAGPNARISNVHSLEPYPDYFAFQYFGLSGNTNVTWSPERVFMGTICAPNAKVTFVTTGMAVWDFVGACAGGSIVLSGHLNVHFDENLLVRGPQR